MDINKLKLHIRYLHVKARIQLIPLMEGASCLAYWMGETYYKGALWAFEAPCRPARWGVEILRHIIKIDKRVISCSKRRKSSHHRMKSNYNWFSTRAITNWSSNSFSLNSISQLHFTWFFHKPKRLASFHLTRGHLSVKLYGQNTKKWYMCRFSTYTLIDFLIL